MNIWQLPTKATLGEHTYELHTDYRDILEIIGYLEDQESPEYLRWQIALALFYEGTIPPEEQRAAIDFLASFISGNEDDAKPSPKLLDWDQDASAIIADVNKVAGIEIRAVKYLHWWTFLSYFQAIGEGQLSTVVSLRDKLRCGKPLEKWEKEYYRKNKERVELKKRYSAEELAEQERLKQLLGE